MREKGITVKIVEDNHKPIFTSDEVNYFISTSGSKYPGILIVNGDVKDRKDLNTFSKRAEISFKSVKEIGLMVDILQKLMVMFEDNDTNESVCDNLMNYLAHPDHQTNK